ncbi:chloride channel protein [Marinomonas balearica]|uniref:H+/Cl-antiporter ClcA n=1 Tax=Marinomonas balearica TaxID=491947 RepID=A0A4R6MA77_9GAMM|nr:chloride channel protein [Marinomonas balearica]TDO98334.1 H+/Cl- antiporter ClcA [Marinomonas balearica]
MISLVSLVHFVSSFIIPQHPENYEALSVLERIIIPSTGCLVLAVFWVLLRPKTQKVGIPYVVERLNYYQGNLPFSNALAQFIGAFIGLAAGLSIGKEGPAAHIGATFGSQLGQRFRLSFENIEVLVACGVTGAIAAAFQTPLAAMLFTFEVIFIRYSMSQVLPVLLSAVSATVLSQSILGHLEWFEVVSMDVPNFDLSLAMVCLVLVGLTVVFASLFFQVQKWLWRFSHWSIWYRFSIVALLTSLVGGLFPQVLGGGYDTINMVFSGGVLATSLFFIAFLKMLLTASSIGLGIPGGMIGPTFSIGGLLGLQVAVWFDTGLPVPIETALFVLLGMASMMAACFQAPLAALLAMLEMTHTSEVIFPAMFVIVLSCLLTKLLFKQDSVFIERLNYLGLSSVSSPMEKQLRSHIVEPVAHSAIVISNVVKFEQIKDFASNMIDYVYVSRSGQWYEIPVSELLSKMSALDFGPHPWLKPCDEVLGLSTDEMSAVLIVEIEEPDSLMKLRSIFKETSADKLLIDLKQSNQLCVVTRKRLDEFFLKEPSPNVVD